MSNRNDIVAKLVEFRSCDKFKVYADLQPAIENSTEKDKEFVNTEMNQCVSELLEVDMITDEIVIAAIKKSIERVEDRGLDTEDKEFCYELYYKIGEITGVDIDNFSQSIEEHMLGSLERMMKKAGINLTDFLKNNPPE